MTLSRRGLGGVAAVGLMFAAALPPVAGGAVSTDPVVTVLYVKGDAEANQIQVDCRSKVVTVNGVPAAEGTASCADLEKLKVFGFGGDDTLTLTGFPLPQPDASFFGPFGEESLIEVYGGDGNDILAGDAVGEVLFGGAGNDVLDGRTSLFAVTAGGPGNDRLLGSAAFGFMLAGAGADRMRAGTGSSFALGQAGRDVFSGSGLSDFASGGRGADKLAGKGGRDLLTGDGGRDSIFGGSGRDLLVGGKGRDRVRGGPGRDLEFQGSPKGRRARSELNELAGLVLFGDDSGDAVIITERLRHLLR